MPATRVARDLAGPFVNHNSYATYVGLISLCATARLVNGAWAQANFQTDLKGSFLAIQYIFGRGALWLVAMVLNLSALIATGSRGGNLATLAALMAMSVFGISLVSRGQRPVQIIAYLAVFVGAIVSLFAINGARLLSHLDDLPAGINDLRFLLWDAARRMIHDAPLTGLGLGTYQAAYPHYARAAVPFVIDKAHNDYLELVAGWGLPAALCWWAALLWLAGLCMRGIFARRRNRVFPLLALGAVILVGIHAIFDFSLQIPAVAATFAAILGLGVAQAFPTRIAENGNP
jgi:O-antigen ligase